MADDTLTLALVTEAFPLPSDWERLPAALSHAAGAGAQLAVLPEIPLNPWSPASKAALDEDAEEVDGPRQQAFAAAARDAGLALLGGAIIRDPVTRVRHNTALLYDRSGSCLGRYRKVHLPEEEGYWETSHYEPGDEPPAVMEGLPLRVGVQICSDVNRTSGFQLLGALGAEVVLAPRCTPPQTWERWKLVLRANAVTSSTYVVSVNRPGPSPHGLIGGPSIAIGPNAEVLVETTEPLALVTLNREAVRASGVEYPGYLKVFPDLYARGWMSVGEGGQLGAASKVLPIQNRQGALRKTVLTTLAAAWREAEAIAKISDDLLVPKKIEEKLEEMKRDVRVLGSEDNP